MIEIEILNELADFTYFYFGLVALEIFVSIFFQFGNNNTITWRFGGNQFIKTTTLISGFVIISYVYYMGDKLLEPLIIEKLVSLELSLIPLSVLSISFSVFYLVKVILERRWMFRPILALLSTMIVSLLITIVMVLNDNSINVW